MTPTEKDLLARIQPLKVKHPAKFGEIKEQWNRGPAQAVAQAELSRESTVAVIMGWWAKAGVSDFCLGHLVYSAARPSRPPISDEQREARKKKQLIRGAYEASIPQLRAVMSVASDRIDQAPKGTTASLAQLDSREEDPAALFAEFTRSIDERLLIEHQPTNGADGFFSRNAAQ